VVAGVFALALFAAIGFPVLDRAVNPGAGQPGVVTFLGVGLAVLTLTSGLLMLGLRGLLPKTGVFLGAVLGYNALLILVKFAISPAALYVASREKGFLILANDSSGFGYFAFPAVALLTGAIYATAFFILYAYFQSKLRHRLGIPVGFEKSFLFLFLVMFCLGGISAITVGAFASIEYVLSFTVMLALAVLLAVALLGALVLCIVAFRDATEQAAVVRNVTLLTAFAWIGLAFIAAYHVVWLVFILTLITIWPLKSMSIK